MIDDLNLEFYPKPDNETIKMDIELINSNKEKWDKPFFIDTQSYLDLKEIKELTKEFHDSVKNVIVLGTGGSIQTLLALKHLALKNIIPITSSRAIELNQCLQSTTPEDSVVIPISRGGETLDVNSTIELFLKRGYKMIGLSSKGTMYNLLKEKKIPILNVPDLSGRFAASISNVAIVPAYISGVIVEEFLLGLEDSYQKFMNYEENLASVFSSFFYNLYKLGFRIIFSMPYSQNLDGIVGLFVQEISESTGKESKGMVGAFQPAPLSQHSVLEFLLGGSKGIVIPLMWTVNHESWDITLTSSIVYINKQSAQDIVNNQADATFQALIEQMVPSAKITVESTSAYNIGVLTGFIQSVVYYLCLLLDVNWANNPKVIIGKEICNDALKNKTISHKRKEIRSEIAKNKFKDFFI